MGRRGCREPTISMRAAGSQTLKLGMKSLDFGIKTCIPRRTKACSSSPFVSMRFPCFLAPPSSRIRPGYLVWFRKTNTF